MRASLSVAVIVATSSALQLGQLDDEQPHDISDQTGISAKPTKVKSGSKYEDKEWPAQNCCRVYTYDDYEVEEHNQNNDWADFCADESDDSEQRFKLADYEKTGNGKTVQWHNRINSFKCGTHVSIKFCDNSKTCNTAPKLEEKEGNWLQRSLQADKYKFYAESAAGGAQNPKTGAKNTHSYIYLTPYDPLEKFAATVFDGSSCAGTSHVVWLDQGKNSSGDTYSNVGVSLKTQGNDRIESVMFPRQGDFWMEFWDADEFKADLSSYGGDTFGHKAIYSAEAESNGCVSNELDGMFMGVTSLTFKKGVRAENQSLDIPDRCCRLFTQKNFADEWVEEGQLAEDLCLGEDSSASFDFNGPQYSHWKQTTASYICGSAVSPTFQLCENDGAISCNDADSAAAGVKNSQVEASHYDALKLDAADPEQPGATLYSQAGCRGKTARMRRGETDVPHFGADIYSVQMAAESMRTLSEVFTAIGVEMPVGEVESTVTCIDLITASEDVSSFLWNFAE